MSDNNIATLNTRFTDTIVLTDGIFNITYNRTKVKAEFRETYDPETNLVITVPETEYKVAETNVFKYLNKIKSSSFGHHGDQMIFVIDMDESSFRDELDFMKALHYDREFWYDLHPAIVSKSDTYSTISSHSRVTPVY